MVKISFDQHFGIPYSTFIYDAIVVGNRRASRSIMSNINYSILCTECFNHE
jgi:hypothetical protein